MKSWKFFRILKYHSPKISWIAIEYYDHWILIFGLARLPRISNPSTDSETSLKVMRYWKFSQKTKLKQKFFINSEKEVGNFKSSTGTIVQFFPPFREIVLLSLKWSKVVMDNWWFTHGTPNIIIDPYNALITPRCIEHPQCAENTLSPAVLSFKSSFLKWLSNYVNWKQYQKIK